MYKHHVRNWMGLGKLIAMELVWGHGQEGGSDGDVVYSHGAAGGHCSKCQVPTFPVLPPLPGASGGSLSVFL